MKTSDFIGGRSFMKVATLAAAFLFLTMAAVHGQNATDTLRIQHSPFAVYKGKIKLKPSQLVGAVSPDQQAMAHMHNAKGNANAAGFLGFAGGFLIGWPIGSLVSGKDPNWAFAGAGFGLALLTIPISSSYRKNATLGVEAFNASKKSMGINTVEMRFDINENGAGFLVKF